MNHKDHVEKREARSPEFRAIREELRPQYEFRRVLIGARIGAGVSQEQLAQRMGTTHLR